MSQAVYVVVDPLGEPGLFSVRVMRPCPSYVWTDEPVVVVVPLTTVPLDDNAFVSGGMTWISSTTSAIEWYTVTEVDVFDGPAVLRYSCVHEARLPDLSNEQFAVTVDKKPPAPVDDA